MGGTRGSHPGCLRFSGWVEEVCRPSAPPACEHVGQVEGPDPSLKDAATAARGNSAHHLGALEGGVEQSKIFGTRRVSQDMPMRSGTHSRISCAMNSAIGVI